VTGVISVSRSRVTFALTYHFVDSQFIKQNNSPETSQQFITSATNLAVANTFTNCSIFFINRFVELTFVNLNKNVPFFCYMQ
jgi:hypothetical protein